MAGCPTIDSRLVQDRAISVAEAAKNFRSNSSGKYLFIDSRSEREHAAARIPGARRLDTWDLDPKDPDPAYDNYSEIIVYGQNPGSPRAEALTKRFYHSKQDHARLMLGGFDEWLRQGHPVEKSPTGETPSAPASP